MLQKLENEIFKLLLTSIFKWYKILLLIKKFYIFIEANKVFIHMLKILQLYYLLGDYQKHL